MTVAGKKVPLYLIIILITLIIVAVFVPTTLLPYLENKPKLEKEHLDAQEQINIYKTSIMTQSKIEENIAKMEKEIKNYNEIMYIDGNSTVNDFENMLKKIKIYDRLDSFIRSEETKTELISSSDKPFYTINISFSVITSKENTLKILNYLETSSNGYYIVNNINSNTILTEEHNSNNEVIAKPGELNSLIDVTLYYLK